jgi:hypothetical protein
MTCDNGKYQLYAEDTKELQLNSGVGLDEFSYQIEYAPEVNGVETLTDLSGYTGEWVFKDVAESSVLTLTTANGGLIFNANNTDGLIYPYATANQITAMNPRSGRGQSRFTLFNADGKVVAGFYKPFRWISF